MILVIALFASLLLSSLGATFSEHVDVDITGTFAPIGVTNRPVESLNPEILGNEPGISSDIHVSHLDNEEAEKVRQQVHRFIEMLKAFIHFTVFASDEFEWATKKLSINLAGLRKSIGKLELGYEDINRSYQLAEFMFDTMVNYNIHSRHYDISTNKALHLLHQVIELRISLFALYDNNGAPDPFSDSYEYKVGRLFEILGFFENEFENLRNVPFSIQYTFFKHYDDAEEALIDLESP